MRKIGGVGEAWKGKGGEEEREKPVRRLSCLTSRLKRSCPPLDLVILSLHRTQIDRWAPFIASSSVFALCDTGRLSSVGAMNSDEACNSKLSLVSANCRKRVQCLKAAALNATGLGDSEQILDWKQSCSSFFLPSSCYFLPTRAKL